VSEAERSKVHPALHLATAAAYGYLAWEFGARFAWHGALFALAAVTQILSVVLRGQPSLVRRINLVCLVLVGLVFTLFITQGLFVLRTFGEMAGDAAWGALLNGVLAIPWLFAVPLVASWPWRRAAVALVVPALPLLMAARPFPMWKDGFTQQDAEVLTRALAGAVWQRLADPSAALPPVDPDLLVLVTTISNGKAAKTRCALGEELPALVAELTRPAGRGAVLVEVPWRHLPAGWLIPGTDAPFRKPCPPSPSMLARNPPGDWVAWGWSSAHSDEPALRFASALASDDGVSAMQAGWTRGEDLSAESIRTFARLGAQHLIHGMTPEGRFSYIVRGPNGEVDKGYNYPRHAGTTWFLARAAVILDDEEIGAAADRALDHLVTLSKAAPGGGVYIDDPMRKDHKVWVGTTGLAINAASLRPKHRETMLGWSLHVARAVDDEGQVRNEAMDEDGEYFPSDHSAYAQGQGMLALAVTQRAMGDQTPPEVRAALRRALDFLSTSAYLGSSHPLIVGDEHWMCIAAHAFTDLYGADDPGVLGARRICEAYLATYRGVPNPDGWRASAASGGGVAEAIIAHAWDTRSPFALKQGEGYAKMLLASQFQPQDAPLLGAPDALIGGVRSAPGKLDVQIDIVQHAACALLSWLAVIEGEDLPGRLP
jgi:hypothetical protein